MKILTTLLIAGLLAACGAGATTPSVNPLPSINDGASELPSTLPTADGTPVAMACEDAFAAVDLTAIGTMGSLDALTDELDATISACGSAEEWVAAAEAALPTIDMTDAQTFLDARCAESATLATTPICTELGL
jgi:hypothetical protein